MKSTTYYYEDELKDEFAGSNIKTRKIDKDYDYTHSSRYMRFQRAFLYRILARPLCRIFLKLRYGHRIVGREKIKELGGKPFFMYANHTNNFADPFIPSLVAYPTDVYVIVHPDNVSIPIIGPIMHHLGALPLPDDLAATKNFMKAIDTCIEEGHCVMIYPEAHIWPFYTKIRPFIATSFAYPVNKECPVMCFTNTYQKRRFTKVPRIVTYVDGPFYPDASLDKKLQRNDLRNRVYNTMATRSQENNVEINKFVKIEEKQ